MKHAISHIGLLFVCLLGMSGGALASSATVELRDSATVDKEVVYVRDIANVRAEGDIGAKIGSISLGYSPSIGSVREITIDRVRLAIGSATGSGETVTVMGPPRVRVERASILLVADDIRDAVRKEVSRHIASPRFLRIDVPEHVAVPIGSVNVKVSIGSAANLFQPFSAAIAIEVDGRVFRRFSSTVAIEAEAEVYLAARDLTAGSRISPEDLWIERRTLKNSPEKYLKKGDRLNGVVLTKAILSGQELTVDTFMSAIVVRTGDMVKIIARSGAVQIAISGQARSSGKVGERIAVKNLQSESVIQATVIDEGVVEVRF